MLAPRGTYLLIDGRRLDPGNQFVPVKEGSELTLECAAEGGNPPPILAWGMTLSQATLDGPEQPPDNLTVLPSTSGRRSGAYLKVLRGHHNATIVCVARHITLMMPMNASILLDVQSLEETFPLIRNAKGVVAAANNRIPQSFVKGGNHRANRKLSVPRRENLQISYLAPFLPSCHYNQRAMRSLHLKPAALVSLLSSSCLLSSPLSFSITPVLLLPSLFPLPSFSLARSLACSFARSLVCSFDRRCWIRASEHLISTQFRWLESTYKPTILLRGNYRLHCYYVLFESPPGLLIRRITSRRV
ncbi:hypothetical protein P5V15_003520 [Pogonomyrmex californicus]